LEGKASDVAQRTAVLVQSARLFKVNPAVQPITRLDVKELEILNSQLETARGKYESLLRARDAKRDALAKRLMQGARLKFDLSGEWMATAKLAFSSVLITALNMLALDLWK